MTMLRREDVKAAIEKVVSDMFYPGTEAEEIWAKRELMDEMNAAIDALPAAEPEPTAN